LQLLIFLGHATHCRFVLAIGTGITIRRNSSGTAPQSLGTPGPALIRAKTRQDTHSHCGRTRERDAPLAHTRFKPFSGAGRSKPELPGLFRPYFPDADISRGIYSFHDLNYDGGALLHFQGFAAPETPNLAAGMGGTPYRSYDLHTLLHSARGSAGPFQRGNPLNGCRRTASSGQNSTAQPELLRASQIRLAEPFKYSNSRWTRQPPRAENKGKQRPRHTLNRFLEPNGREKQLFLFPRKKQPAAPIAAKASVTHKSRVLVVGHPRQ